jgi:hypothetical protein
MTAPRQVRKWSIPRIIGLIIGLGVFAITASAFAAPAPLVVDVHTGLALSGFDPVAYFTDHKPELGRAGLELRQDGAVWRFCNEGNRAAFADHPEIYGPRFGGYDPVAIARGASVAGHPLIWAVVSARLYLFYSTAARAAFLSDPGRVIMAAERKWPTVARTISR